jgi:hypothetical protein
MAFTEAAEFARSIQVDADTAAEEKPPAAAAPSAARESSSHMGIDDDEPPAAAAAQLATAAAEPQRAPATSAKWGNWVVADEENGGDADEDMPDVKVEEAEDEEQERVPVEESVTRERVVGKGAPCSGRLQRSYHGHEQHKYQFHVFVDLLMTHAQALPGHWTCSRNVASRTTQSSGPAAT